jgi:hypothetical protein
LSRANVFISDATSSNVSESEFFEESFMADNTIYRGTGNDLQAAILAAHELYRAEAVKKDPAKDLFTTSVLTMGVETGGFVQSTTYFAEVRETPHVPG